MLISILAPLLLMAQASEPAAAGSRSDEADTGTTSQTSRDRSNVPDGTIVIDKKEVRCRYERSVNSRIPKKVCHTLAEWEERQKMQEEEMRALRNRSSACGSEGPC